MKRHGRQFVILSIFTIALVGCGKNKKDDGPPRWQDFPVKIYTDPTLVANAQSVADFNDAMEFWESRVGKKLFDYQGNWNGNPYNGDSVNQNAAFFQQPWNYAANIAAQTIVLSQKAEIQGAVIMVNPGTNFCGGDCTGLSTSTSLRKVFAHELGHFVGLNHVADTGDIMYPDALPGGSLDALHFNVTELAPLVN